MWRPSNHGPYQLLSPFIKPEGGLTILHEAEDDAVNWLNSVHGDYGTRGIISCRVLSGLIIFIQTIHDGIVCKSEIDGNETASRRCRIASGVTIIFGTRQTFATGPSPSIIHNSGHFGPPLSFWAPGPPGITGAADG